MRKAFAGGSAIVALALLLGFASSSFAQADTKDAQKVKNATAVLNEIMATPDKAIPSAILDKAVGIAVFPDVLKAAFLVGGEYGYGILSEKEANGRWSKPAFLKLKGGSWGAQLGGESTDLVLVVMNRKGLDDLMQDQFKIGGEAEAAAGPVGRNAQAATDVQLRAEILSYSRSRGLFAGISLSGASISEDIDANQRFYGNRYHTREIVAENLAKRGEAPVLVAAWRNTLDKYLAGPVATSGTVPKK